MKRICALICSLLMLFCAVGCVSPFREEDQIGEFTPEIDPEPGDNPGTVLEADLWIPLKSRDYFAVKSNEITVSSGERVEMAVAKKLLSQDAPGDILTAPGWKGLSVQAISDDNQTLYVTLNKEFLSPPTVDPADAADMARVAVLSLTNTLLGLGDYTQVQILVEMASSGKVQRPTRQQAGFLGADENAVLGPLMYREELLLTPETAAEMTLRFTKEMNSLALYDVLCRTPATPDVFEFQVVMQKMPEDVGDFEVVDVEMDGVAKATVYVDITFVREGEERLETRIPLACRRENGIWKVEYETFEELVLQNTR